MQFVQLQTGYSSELEDESSRRRELQLLEGRAPVQSKPTIDNEKRRHFNTFMAMDAYSRHKQFCNDMIKYYGGLHKLQQTHEMLKRTHKTDIDVLREEHRFIRTEEDDKEPDEFNAWRKRIARKYYDKLFKEYCLIDLSHYKEGKVGLRWRIEKEVITGKGQFSCGNKRCLNATDLTSFEVPFSYMEDNQRKRALVKVRLCDDCGHKLNYKYPHARKMLNKQAKRRLESSETKHSERRSKKSKTEKSDSEASSGDSSSSEEEEEKTKQASSDATKDEAKANDTTKPATEPALIL
eukprot:c17555_g1_i1.p3 GENE.c17555_g1_i1~~c17555_g1_i1.p3  ORF type:complete len:294 (+),score=86.34 c17555_g1_i1:35-916(+)